MALAADPRQNRLFAALPDPEWARWRPRLEPADVPLGYFPATSIVSLLYVMENGASAEIAVVGFEGIAGVALFMGARPRRVAQWCKARAGDFGWTPA